MAERKKSRTWFKQCNHKKSTDEGNVIYSDGAIGPCIHWCTNCGAINPGTGWRYPERARADHSSSGR